MEKYERFFLWPLNYPDLYNLYKMARKSYWVPEEIILSNDKFNELDADEQRFIKMVLAFFAGSDGLVNENLVVNFYNEIHIAEARLFYAIQIGIEAIHAETYNLLLDKYTNKDEDEKLALMHAIKDVPSINKKAEWVLRWMNSTHSLAERLVAFAAVEGIFFSGSFCAIFWLKKRGLMPGLAFSNELISRDEGLHTDFACLLYSMLVNKPPQDVPKQIILEAVEIEKEFVTDSLPVALIGMNAELMCQYIEFVADRLLVALGCQKHYNSTNPFPWMELISLEGKTNFFERRVGEYAKAGVSAGNQTQQHVFTLNEDF